MNPPPTVPTLKAFTLPIIDGAMKRRQGGESLAFLKLILNLKKTSVKQTEKSKERFFFT
jgi:hypothetical protein